MRIVLLAIVLGIALLAEGLTARALPAFENCDDASVIGSHTTWTQQTNSIETDGVGECKGNTPGDYNRAFDSGNTYANNQYCQFVLRAGSYPGCGVRMSGTGGSAQGYNILTSTTANSSRIQEVTAGVEATIGPGGNGEVSPAIGDLVRFEAEGTTLRYYINGILQVSVTDASIASGRAGIVIYSTTSRLDSWQAGDLGGSTRSLLTILGCCGL